MEEKTDNIPEIIFDDGEILTFTDDLDFFMA